MYPPHTLECNRDARARLFAECVDCSGPPARRDLMASSVNAWFSLVALAKCPVFGEYYRRTDRGQDRSEARGYLRGLLQA